MSHRTTFALDDATVTGIRKLAAAWGVSQSEVVRRAVGLAERRVDHQRKDPLQRLTDYHGRGGLDRRTADVYLQQVAEDRGAWRGRT